MCKMKKKQKVTFDADTKPPNCGHMKLHTKPIKRKDKDEDIDDKKMKKLFNKQIKSDSNEKEVKPEYNVEELEAKLAAIKRKLRKS